MRARTGTRSLEPWSRVLTRFWISPKLYGLGDGIRSTRSRKEHFQIPTGDHSQPAGQRAQRPAARLVAILQPFIEHLVCARHLPCTSLFSSDSWKVGITYPYLTHRWGDRLKKSGHLSEVARPAKGRASIRPAGSTPKPMFFPPP